MKIINASYEILTRDSGINILKAIERAGRTCYKSEEKITDESAIKFVGALVKNKHEAMLEHASISVKIICDRGVSHELVRHRLASYAQESTRYCNYSKDKFGNELTFIDPSEAFGWKKNGDKELSRLWCIWEESMKQAEANYFELLGYGAAPQEARDVLPNSIKTEIIITMNLREWMHFFRLRALGRAGKPHPQMLEITVPMLEDFKKLIPVVFDTL